MYLFDEFDALGGDRSGNDVGEARRILNSFLLFLENSGSESIVVAATNHMEILDRALFRRFDLVLSYELPTEDQAVTVLKNRLGPLVGRIGWKTIEQASAGLSHAGLVQAAEVAAEAVIVGWRDSDRRGGVGRGASGAKQRR